MKNATSHPNIPNKFESYDLKHTYVDYFACTNRNKRDCKFSFDNYHKLDINKL